MSQTGLMTKMSIAQYNDMRKAQADGDQPRAEAIVALGYQKEYDPSDVGATEADIIEQAYTEENILDDVAAGLENAEICEKYEISPQKLGSLKKKAK